MAIYLDNAATSFPKPESVYNAVTDYMRCNGASPGRGNYAKAREADRLVYLTRKALCKLFGAARPGQVIFTSNATEAINMALKGYLRPKDRVLTTSYEHNAMWRPLKSLERDLDIQIIEIPSAPEGYIDLSLLQSKLDESIRLVAVAHSSNVTGCITPISEVVSAAHEYGVPVLADAAQTAGTYPINLMEIPVDMLAFTGHKGLLGPTGTGGLILRQSLELRTFKDGGTGGMSASPYMPEGPPDRYEAGTMNISGLAGLYASICFLLDTGVDNIRAHETKLMDMLMKGLQTIPRLRFYGPDKAENRLGLISFNLEGHDPHKIAARLDEEYGIMVRAGLHCAPQAHRMLGTDQTGAVRASLGYFNSETDIACLLEALCQMAD